MFLELTDRKLHKLVVVPEKTITIEVLNSEIYGFIHIENSDYVVFKNSTIESILDDHTDMIYVTDSHVVLFDNCYIRKLDIIKLWNVKNVKFTNCKISAEGILAYNVDKLELYNCEIDLRGNVYKDMYFTEDNTFSIISSEDCYIVDCNVTIRKKTEYVNLEVKNVLIYNTDITTTKNEKVQFYMNNTQTMLVTDNIKKSLDKYFTLKPTNSEKNIIVIPDLVLDNIL